MEVYSRNLQFEIYKDTLLGGRLCQTRNEEISFEYTQNLVNQQSFEYPLPTID